MRPVGTQWLLKHYSLPEVVATHRSRIGSRRQTKINSRGEIDDVFPQNYWPGDHALDHVEFLLKYGNLSLDLLEKG